MNSFYKVSALAFNQSQPVAEPNKTNVIKPNFKAGNDSFVRQQVSQNQQALQRQRQIEDFQKEQKKQKTKNNIMTGVSIASGLAIIAMVLMQARMMRGGGTPGEFRLSNLEFKNLANDESIFDLMTTKSLHPKVKKFFTDLLKKGKVPEIVSKRAGTLGEAGTNSVLLLGGSGVGKTEIIKAYAKAADADYVAIKLSDFSNSYINGTSKNITEMINALIHRAKENPNRQLVISLDEVDALVKLTAHDTSGEIAKNRQSLLTGMDELLKLKNIKLFTSSNANVASLDGAFLRRCGYNFEVPMPDKTQLLEAMKFQLRKCEGAMENDGAFFKNNKELEDFLQKLVDRRCAFGDVQNICKAAKDKYELVMTDAGNDITKKFEVNYLKEALDTIQTTAGEKAMREGSFV